jgi:hypothetical protein
VVDGSYVVLDDLRAQASSMRIEPVKYPLQHMSYFESCFVSTACCDSRSSRTFWEISDLPHIARHPPASPERSVHVFERFPNPFTAELPIVPLSIRRRDCTSVCPEAKLTRLWMVRVDQCCRVQIW